MNVLIVICLTIATTMFEGSDAICGECPFKYKRVGCYKDRRDDRALPQQLLNERDPFSAAANGFSIDWYNWNEYMPAIVCRCAKIALEKGYKYFGLQFWGECWSGPSPAADEDYDRHGEGGSCFGKGYQLCSPWEKNCVGDNSHNFIYEIAAGDCAVNFDKVGCFNDKTGKDVLALTARDHTSPAFMGEWIDWVNYDTFLPEFACKCAEKAAQAGYDVFGLQYYGECWTGAELLERAWNDGRSGNCINNCFKRCERYDPICIGEGFANTVYQISRPSCEIDYENVGCYWASGEAGPSLARILINEVYPPSDVFDGTVIAFDDNWEKQIKDLICRCARKAKLEGYATFGIQNDGECWSGQPGSENYEANGYSDRCYGKDYSSCQDPKKCAGDSTSVNVFRLV